MPPPIGGLSARPRPAVTVFINGRFLTQPVTGVQRYAHELVAAFDRLLEAGVPRAVKEVVLLTPSVGLRYPIALKRIAHRPIGRLRGHAWEQLELPAASRRGVLLSPA